MAKNNSIGKELFQDPFCKWRSPYWRFSWDTSHCRNFLRRYTSSMLCQPSNLSVSPLCFFDNRPYIMYRLIIFRKSLLFTISTKTLKRKSFIFLWNGDTTMVFCFQNCSHLIWEKIDQERLLKFEAEVWEFAKLEQW